MNILTERNEIKLAMVGFLSLDSIEKVILIENDDHPLVKYDFEQDIVTRRYSRAFVFKNKQNVYRSCIVGIEVNSKDYEFLYTLKYDEHTTMRYISKVDSCKNTINYEMIEKAFAVITKRISSELFSNF